MFPPYNPYGPYADLAQRIQILGFHVKLPWIGTGKVLLVGDSITENLIPPCHGILNFGVSGARAHDLLPYAQQIVSTAQPSKTVLLVGTNDLADATLDYWHWQQDYFNLVVGLNSPVLMTILPTEKVTQPYLAAHNNPTKLAQYNQYIKDTGSTLGLKVIDAAAALAGPDGYLSQGSTYDGLHPIGALNGPLWAQFEQAMS